MRFNPFKRKKNKRSSRRSNTKRNVNRKKRNERAKIGLSDKVKSIHGKPDTNLLLIVSVLIVAGLLMVASASFYYGFVQHEDTFYYPKRQILWIVIGIVAAYIVYLIPLERVKKASPFLLFGGILFLLYILPEALFGSTFKDPETGDLIATGIQMPLVEALNGAPRWINFGITYLQPSEFVKIALIIYISAWLVKDDVQKHEQSLGDHIQNVVMPFMLLLGSVSVLILLQRDFDTTVVMALAVLAVYYVSGTQFLHSIGSFIILGFSSLVGVFALFLEGYRRARVESWFNIFLHGEPKINANGISDALDGAFQVWNGLIGVGSGGVSGTGFTESVVKQGYLQEAAYTDSIFVVIGEEFGFIGTVFVIVIFVTFASIGFNIAKNSPDKFNGLLAIGITSLIVFQALLNIAAVLVLIPFGGMPLPFFTYGGSVTIATMVGVGLLLNVSRENNRTVSQKRSRR